MKKKVNNPLSSRLTKTPAVTFIAIIVWLLYVMMVFDRNLQKEKVKTYDTISEYRDTKEIGLLKQLVEYAGNGDYTSAAYLLNVMKRSEWRDVVLLGLENCNIINCYNLSELYIYNVTKPEEWVTNIYSEGPRHFGYYQLVLSHALNIT